MSDRYPSLDRRTALKATGATLAAAAGGLYLLPGGASAQITTDELVFPEQPTPSETEEGDPYSPWVFCSGEFSFSVDGPVDEWRVALKAGHNGGDFETLAETSGAAPANEMEGRYDLRGVLVEHSAWDPIAFRAADGESTEYDLPVRVLLDVTEGGDTVATANAETVVKLVVTDTTVTARGGVVGTGHVGWQQSEEGPTPTPPGS